MKFWGVLLNNGKWLSRGRFSSDWDGVFELDDPELWVGKSGRAAALDAARRHDGALIEFAFNNKEGALSDREANAWAERRASSDQSGKFRAAPEPHVEES